MKRKIGSFWSMRYGREVQTKNKQHIRRKIAFCSREPMVRRSLHTIFTARYFQRRLSPLPLDSLTFALLWFGRLAADLKVNEWNPSLPAYTHGADVLCSDSHSRLLPRHEFEKMKRATLFEKSLKVIKSVSLWRGNDF